MCLPVQNSALSAESGPWSSPRRILQSEGTSPQTYQLLPWIARQHYDHSEAGGRQTWCHLSEPQCAEPAASPSL